MKLKDIQKHWNQYASEIIQEAFQQSKVYEGLITSQRPSFLKRKILDVFPLKKPRILDNTDRDHSMSIFLTYPFNVEQLKKVMSIADVSGWIFIGAAIRYGGEAEEQITERNFDALLSKLHLLPPKTTIMFNLEAKHGHEINDIQKTHSVLYHITPTKNVEKIMKIGLTPRTQNKIANHPERIYLGTNLKELQSGLLNAMKMTTEEKDWTILKIDTSFFTKPGVKLFTDPMYDFGMYTLSNIPPYYITIEKQIKG